MKEERKNLKQWHLVDRREVVHANNVFRALGTLGNLGDGDS